MNNRELAQQQYNELAEIVKNNKHLNYTEMKNHFDSIGVYNGVEDDNWFDVCFKGIATTIGLNEHGNWYVLNVDIQYINSDDEFMVFDLVNKVIEMDIIKAETLFGNKFKGHDEWLELAEYKIHKINEDSFIVEDCQQDDCDKIFNKDELLKWIKGLEEQDSFIPFKEMEE